MSVGVSDAVSALRWGLRQYALLFVVCVLAVGVGIPVLIAQAPKTYEAPALVVAQSLLMDLAALPRYAEETFDGGQVARAVADRFADNGDFDNIVPDRVSLVAEQDNIVLRVIGHGDTAQAAADVANVAVGAFIEQLNLAGEGVGRFVVQSLAEPPMGPEDPLASTPVALAVGIAAGLLTGLAVISLLLMARRPVLDAADAEQVTGVTVLGTVTIPRLRARRILAGSDVAGLVPVCRRLLAKHPRVILLMAVPGSEAVRGQLASALADVLGRVRIVRVVTPSDEREAAGAYCGDEAGPGSRIGLPDSGDRSSEITLIDGPHPIDVMASTESSMVILLAVQGVPERRLRSAVAEHLSGDSSDRLLIVNRRGRADGIGRKQPLAGSRTTERHPALVVER